MFRNAAAHSKERERRQGGAQLARSIVAIREDHPIDPFLRMAVAEMPRVKVKRPRLTVTRGR